MTLHEDGTATQAAAAPDKAQEVTTKAHGSQAPPSPSDETIHTTEQHPWLTTDRGWVTAGDLRVGEHVVELGGRTATITALHARPGAADYYNLTVSTLHTYAVGASQAVVHNTNGPCGPTYPQLADERAKAVFGDASQGWWSRVELTVGAGYFPDAEGGVVRVVTINESAMVKYGKTVEDLARAGGDTWIPPIRTAAGDAHAEDTLRAYGRQIGQHPLGIGASKYFCGRCFDNMTQVEGWSSDVLGTASPDRGFVPVWMRPNP